MHPQAVAPAGLGHRDSVVQVLGLGPVDGNDVLVPKVPAALKVLGPQGLGHGLGLSEGPGREFEGQAMLVDYREDVGAGGVLVAQPLDDPALGVFAPLGPTGDFHHHFFLVSGAAVIVLIDENVPVQAFLVGDDKAVLLALVKSAHHRGVVTLKDANHFALGLCPAALAQEPRHHPVIVHSAVGVRLGDKDILPTLFIGDEEGKPLGIALEVAHYQIHALRHAVPVPASANDFPPGFHRL